MELEEARGQSSRSPAWADGEPVTAAPSREGRPATIYDVAAAAGVSHQTVSRFLRGFEGIRPETRARVTAALDALGYRPNMTARSLKSGRSHRIGALTHESSQVGPTRIAEAASAAAREAGYILDLISLDMRSSHAIDDALDQLTQHSLAGILALASTDEMVRAVADADFRVPIFLETEVDEPTSFSETGVTELVEHLAGLGHRRFLHIAGPPNWSSARGRQRAYEAAIARLGLTSTALLHGDWTAASGYQALASRRDVMAATAVIAANDQMALGAMLALKESGRRIPEDVSVVGLDDIPEAAYFDPPLTTLRNDFDRTGREAVLALIARIEGRPVPARSAQPPLLVTRRSSGPAPS
ncbi:LacI family DNA-binding transcriptional regulator [Microbacterium sp. HD4P20]|uniref:LacI family DNA-binding transcriptional regulator n=1 Tax=Microbacterium sp. HD4P20 TaxID=2864874 RepID=UPI001C641DC4|nr:LacI family DNA-binding transcriptional regulator [Microbacterium sp. HD4P20]MCP2636118.1 LacI family DNA-binding transcriptional regulator [Microbacterium sp. HD4P20]